MEHIAVALETLNNFNPLVLVIVLFGLIIILIIAALYAFIRWGLPAISTFVTEWSDSFQAASASWRELVVEQKLNNEQFFAQEGLNIRLTASFGIATYPEDADTKDKILQIADERMYRIKDSHKNDIAFS